MCIDKIHILWKFGEDISDTDLLQIFTECVSYQYTYATIFCDIILRHRALLPACPKTVSKIKILTKLGWFRINYGIFSKYSKPLHKLVKALALLILRHFLFLSDLCFLYDPFGSRTLFRSCKNSGNIGLLKIKPKFYIYSILT